MSLADWLLIGSFVVIAGAAAWQRWPRCPDCGKMMTLWSTKNSRGINPTRRISLSVEWTGKKSLSTTTYRCNTCATKYVEIEHETHD